MSRNHVFIPPSSAPRHNLPAPTSSFIGRTHELEQLLLLLDRTRLLTLVGAGGIGKSRLAQRVAACVAPAHSRQHAENGLALARDTGDKQEMGGILVLVGCVAADQGDRDRAREVIAEAVELGVEGFRFGRGEGGLAGCAFALAHLATTLGRLEEAVLLDAAVAAWFTTQSIAPSAYVSATDQRVAAARQTLGDARVDRAVAKGQWLCHWLMLWRRY